MADFPQRQGDELFIVDNSDSDWKVRDYLREWSGISRAFDIATGYFEIGALLALDKQWQQLERIRILMGDEVSKRTKKALLAGIQNVKQILDVSLEKEKEKNDFLTGVPAIVEAIRDRKIECRVYTKEKFHAEISKLNKLRNDTIHNGKVVTRVEARQACNTICDVLSFLNSLRPGVVPGAISLTYCGAP